MKTLFPWKELGYAFGGLLLLLALYGGAYFAMVSRENVVKHTIMCMKCPYSVCVMEDGKPVQRTYEKECLVSRPHYHVVAKYSYSDVLGADSLRSFFSPIHDTDRRVRTDFWDDQELNPARPPAFPLPPEIESADFADDPPLEPIPSPD